MSFIYILNQRPAKYEFSTSVSVYHATQAKIILSINSSLPQEVYMQSEKELLYHMQTEWKHHEPGEKEVLYKYVHLTV